LPLIHHDSVSLVAPADCVHQHRGGHEDISVRCLFVADVRSYERDHLIFEVSRELACAAAIERYTASRNSRPPAPTELQSPMCVGARRGQWGAVHRALKPLDQPGGDLTHTDGFTNA
jgi:hypothetical protein